MAAATSQAEVPKENTKEFSKDASKDLPKDLPKELAEAQEFADDETVVGEQSGEFEEKFRNAVEKLKTSIEEYHAATQKKDPPEDEAVIKEKEKNVYDALKEAAEASPNPKVKEYYYNKAMEFLKVGRTAKKVLSNDLVKGTLFILSSPVALVGSVAVATGGLLYGVGSVVKGVGDLLSGMTFSGTVLGTKEDPKEKDPEKTDAGTQSEENEGEGEGEGEGKKEQAGEENAEDAEKQGENEGKTENDGKSETATTGKDNV